MSDKSLQDKAIKIQNKDYVLVSDRVLYFNEVYKNGYIKTKLLSEPQADMVVVKAYVIPDTDKPQRYFTGLSQAKWGQGMVNRTSAMENAETSAVGRALAMMGIGVIDSIASADELKKAVQQPEDPATPENDVYLRAVLKEACPKCHAPMKLSKNNKPYCSALCWKGDK